jgi:hypothetical protein
LSVNEAGWVGRFLGDPLVGIFLTTKGTVRKRVVKKAKLYDIMLKLFDLDLTRHALRGRYEKMV